MQKNLLLKIIMLTAWFIAFLIVVCGSSCKTIYTGGRYCIDHVPVEVIDERLETSYVVKAVLACYTDEENIERCGTAKYYLPDSLAYIILLPDGTRATVDENIIQWKNRN